MLEEKLAALVAAVEANTAAVEKLTAGRDAALAKLEEKVATAEPKPATRSRRKAAEPEAEAPAAEPETATPATAAAFDDDVLRNEVKDYIGGGKTDDERAARQANVATVVNHFGGKLVGPDSKLDDEQKAQALFYVRRFAAGCTVNYSEEYDFAGDPTQVGLDAAADTNDFDDIG